MRALVTGGVGFVGTNLCERLINDNHEVWSFDNYTTGDRKNKIKGVKYYKIDIRDGFKNWSQKFDVIKNMPCNDDFSITHRQTQRMYSWIGRDLIYLGKLIRSQLNSQILRNLHFSDRDTKKFDKPV